MYLYFLIIFMMSQVILYQYMPILKLKYWDSTLSRVTIIIFHIINNHPLIQCCITYKTDKSVIK